MTSRQSSGRSWASTKRTRHSRSSSTTVLRTGRFLEGYPGLKRIIKIPRLSQYGTTPGMPAGGTEHRFFTAHCGSLGSGAHSAHAKRSTGTMVPPEGYWYWLEPLFGCRKKACICLSRLASRHGSGTGSAWSECPARHCLQDVQQ